MNMKQENAVADPHYSLEAALEELQRIQQMGGTRPWRLCIRKANPGGLTAHQTVEVQAVHAGFDWEAGRVIITPAMPLTEISIEDVEAIRKSVRDGASWHAYKAQERLRERIKELEAQVARLSGSAQRPGCDASLPSSP